MVKQWMNKRHLKLICPKLHRRILISAAFEYFGWKYPQRLSTLCKQASESTTHHICTSMILLPRCLCDEEDHESVKICQLHIEDSPMRSYELWEV